MRTEGGYRKEQASLEWGPEKRVWQGVLQGARGCGGYKMYQEVYSESFQ